VDRATFAALLSDRLRGDLDDSPVTFSARRLGAWEDGDEPVPAVVLLAAAELANLEVEVLLGRLPVLARIERLERQLSLQGQQLRMLSDQLG